MRLDAPELEAVARYRRTVVSVEFDGQSNSRFVSYVEAPFFQIFDFDAVAGDLGATTMPRTAVITRHAAQQMFGTDEVVGKIVTISGAQGIVNMLEMATRYVVLAALKRSLFVWALAPLLLAVFIVWSIYWQLRIVVEGLPRASLRLAGLRLRRKMLGPFVSIVTSARA